MIADRIDQGERMEPTVGSSAGRAGQDTSQTGGSAVVARWGPILVVVTLCGLHAALIWAALGGWPGLTSPEPLLQADFGFHLVHAVEGRDFLRASGFTAGYSPSFMAGFPMSVVSGTSSTWSTLIVTLLGGSQPVVAFKFSVLTAILLGPWLIAWASVWFGARPSGVAWAVGLFLIYVWTDFPNRYIYFGMVSFFLAVPLGLVAVAALVRYLDGGGLRRWIWAASLCSSVFFVHASSPMTVAPAGLLVYLVAWVRGARGQQSFPVSRQVGFWLLAPVILAVNAFWWLPGYWLWSTVGATDFAFNHSRESVWRRLGEIFTQEAPVEATLFAVGLPGLILLRSLRPMAALGLAGSVLAGVGWGYLAGFSAALDALQPGRQTYAGYASLCVAAGILLGEVAVWLQQARPGRLDRWLAVGFLLLGLRLFGPALSANGRAWVGQGEPMLSSRPLPIFARLITAIRTHCQPGDRLLFEETGQAVPGETDPFFGRHLSPLLPSLTGVEVLGGPYLHTPVQTNFTQFGEGKLFGQTNWGRAQFVRYARLYRPTAIACWTRQARAFCLGNPDLVQILADDGAVLLGRVVGFGGATIQGAAEVEAGPNRLVVRNLVGDASGLVVLRYHATPCLVADPATPTEPVFQEDDPVPFIGLRPTQAGPITLRLQLPPPSGWFRSPAGLRRP